MRPICINPGCGKNAVPMKGKVGQPGVRYRVYCGNCHISSYSDMPLKPGVTPYKKNCCTNQDGHLGFPCITDHTKFDRISTKGKFEIDHKDGDPHNNDPDNLQELCQHCHTEKGMLGGDYNGHRSTPKRIAQAKKSIAASTLFDSLFNFTYA